MACVVVVLFFGFCFVAQFSEFASWTWFSWYVFGRGRFVGTAFLLSIDDITELNYFCLLGPRLSKWRFGICFPVFLDSRYCFKAMMLNSTFIVETI